MADDRKRGDLVSAKVTERMLLDLNRLAAKEERSMSEFLYMHLREWLYGEIVRMEQLDEESSSSTK